MKEQVSSYLATSFIVLYLMPVSALAANDVNFHARMTRFRAGFTRKADHPDTLCSLSGATLPHQTATSTRSP